MTRRSLLACGAALATRGVLLAADADVRITLSLEKKQYRVGEVIPLTWTLENATPRPLAVIAYEETGGGRQYQHLSLQLSLGGGPPRPVPTSFPTGAVRPVWNLIPSRETLDQELNLSRCMDLMTPKPGTGSYRLTAQYAMSATTSPAGDPAWNGRTAPAIVDFEIVA